VLRSVWLLFRSPPKHEWTLIFMHLPKTAGSSFRDAVGRLYSGAERIYLYHPQGLKGAIDPERFPELPLERRARLRFVAGHITYGLHEHVPRQSRYVTIVREPVDRVVSVYHHFRRVGALGGTTPAAVEGRRILESSLSLEDWVFGRQRSDVDNLIVRLVSGRDAPFGQCPDDMLDDALARVDESFEQVLIYAQLPRCMALLSARLGTSLPTLRKLNVNEQRPPLAATDAAVLARVRELNRLDEAFYRAMLDRVG
jgi:hypothetical protein